MRRAALVILIALLSLIPALSTDQVAPPAAATVGLPPTITRTVNSFEGATPDDVTVWGSWTDTHSVAGGGSIADVTTTGAQFHHALQSADLEVGCAGLAGRFASATLLFTSNVSRGTAPFDSILIRWMATGIAPLGTSAWIYFKQMDAGGATLLTTTIVLFNSGWHLETFTPIWDSAAAYFRLEFHAFASGDDGGGAADVYVDYLTIVSSVVDVRVRFWNQYTGFGILQEKFRVRYYDSGAGAWVDVWQNEFQSYPFQSELLTVTDIFDRNIWTGYFEVDRNPYYVDLLVPLLTVVIQKPDQWDDSLPWEWRIACLPNGPSAPEGVSLMSIGFEFEVLAGWYTFEWYQTNVYKGGNLSIFLDGNISTRSSHMLTNVTLQLKPTYERTDQGKVLNASNPADWIPILIALFEEPTVRLFTYAIGTIFAVSALSGFIINRVLKDRRERALKSHETTVRLEAKLDKITEKLEEDE
jgi:hypothetical protein